MLMEQYTDGICMGLFDEFGSDYEICTEPVKMGMSEPCFTVLSDGVTITPAIGGQNMMNCAFTVHYYPGNEEGFSDCHAVLERIYSALGLIRVGTRYANALTFSGMVNEEGVLEVKLSYAQYFTFNTENELMGVLSGTVAAE